MSLVSIFGRTKKKRSKGDFSSAAEKSDIMSVNCGGGGEELFWCSDNSAF